MSRASYPRLRAQFAHGRHAVAPLPDADGGDGNHRPTQDRLGQHVVRPLAGPAHQHSPTTPSRRQRTTIEEDSGNPSHHHAGNQLSPVGVGFTGRIGHRLPDIEMRDRAEEDGEPHYKHAGRRHGDAPPPTSGTQTEDGATDASDGAQHEMNQGHIWLLDQSVKARLSRRREERTCDEDANRRRTNGSEAYGGQASGHRDELLPVILPVKSIGLWLS